MKIFAAFEQKLQFQDLFWLSGIKKAISLLERWVVILNSFRIKSSTRLTKLVDGAAWQYFLNEIQQKLD